MDAAVRYFAPKLLKCHFGEAPELSRMQRLSPLGLQFLKCSQTNLEVLADALPIEFAGHACELDLTVKRPVRHTKQCAVRHAEAETIGGNRR
jgi:hypothetical protein